MFSSPDGGWERWPKRSRWNSLKINAITEDELLYDGRWQYSAEVDWCRNWWGCGEWNCRNLHAVRHRNRAQKRDSFISVPAIREQDRGKILPAGGEVCLHIGVYDGKTDVFTSAHVKTQQTSASGNLENKRFLKSPRRNSIHRCNFPAGVMRAFLAEKNRPPQNVQIMRRFLRKSHV